MSLVLNESDSLTPHRSPGSSHVSGQANRDLSSQHSVEVTDVTVAYRAYTHRPTSLKESVIRMLRGNFQKTYSTFNALSNVTFNVPKGTVFAIVGSNGCGKSTLLKVLAGVLKPVTGSVRINGEVASLIELGAGFDPELTGVENIYLNGSLHKRNETFMKNRVKQILDFAELHEFAHTPVKYYSSGMYARLGFSVAVDIDPDVLLVDEILSVGDERFQDKCKGVFADFIKRGKTIILVSHDLGMIENKAHQAVLLERGKPVFIGDPKKAVEMYRNGTYKTVLG